MPDELQVEDELWKGVLAESDRSFQRDRPQRLLSRWFLDHEREFLDLLPAFRAVPALEDGDRHLFLLRNGHRNVRGDQLVGSELPISLGKNVVSHSPP